MPPENFANLTGKTAVVTGSSNGIGRAIALEFARSGAAVVVHCRRSESAAQKIVDDINHRSPGKASLIRCDVSQTAELPQFVQACWDWQGEVDIWVNNAGADLLTGDGKVLPPERKLTTLWETDVRSTVLLARDAGSRMKRRGSGTILNIGWDQADRGMEGDSGELFAASKNAIMGFTRSLAVSLAPNVRVNCIAPGWIKTAWGDGASEHWHNRVLKETPLGRWGLPADVAATARFLASDEAGFITGQVINVNGGAVR